MAEEGNILLISNELNNLKGHTSISNHADIIFLFTVSLCGGKQGLCNSDSKSTTIQFAPQLIRMMQAFHDKLQEGIQTKIKHQYTDDMKLMKNKISQGVSCIEIQTEELGTYPRGKTRL